MQRRMSDELFAERIEDARKSLAAREFSNAASQFRDILEEARDADRENVLVYALRHAAIAELELGQFAEALGRANEALDIYARRDTRADINTANTLRLIALAKDGLGREKEAREDWSEARRLYEANQIEDGVAECDTHLSDR